MKELLEDLNGCDDGYDIFEIFDHFLKGFGDWSPGTLFWSHNIAKVSFEQHVKIFAALLQKQVKGNKALINRHSLCILCFRAIGYISYASILNKIRAADSRSFFETICLHPWDFLP